MREQLRREIVKRTGEYVQSAAAAAAYEEESTKIAAEFDRLVAEGKTELEAYRAMLDDIEAMKLLLASIPPSEKIREEQAKKEKRLNRKFRKMAGGMQGILWILTPIWYFLSSFMTGNWHLTWLIFLGSAAGSILLDILVKYNEGTPLRKCGGWHGIFWLCLVMFYFTFSFASGQWALSWLLFPAGAIVEILWKMLDNK
ncbi:MAG: hypothetical protein E7631_06310 [Ruminococcaceae bacterium]|nr:hypothetical protein [Oscillospiraceae bacterium]